MALPRADDFAPPLLEADFDDLPLLDLDELFLPPDFAPRELLDLLLPLPLPDLVEPLAPPDLRPLPLLLADFPREAPKPFALEDLDLEAAFLLPPEDFALLLAEDFFPPVFLLKKDLPEPIPVARCAAPVAFFTAAVAVALADATFFGSLAALPVIAPIKPPTTAPTGPATLPMTAPAAAPAVVLEIDGTSIFSDADSLPDDC